MNGAFEKALGYDKLDYLDLASARLGKVYKRELAVWQAAEALWRKEFARVTGLGIEATLEEIIEHYMDTVNQAVAWRDELAHGLDRLEKLERVRDEADKVSERLSAQVSAKLDEALAACLKVKP